MSVVRISDVELSKWRLYLLDTRQLWFHQDEDIEALEVFTPEQKDEIRALFRRPQTWVERFQLRPPVPRAATTGQKCESSEDLESRAESCMNKLVDFYVSLQAEDGQYPCDHPCLEFLIPVMVFNWYLSKRLPPACIKDQIVAKILNTQLPYGGWGLTEHNLKPVLFTSTINYVALRMLGCDPSGELEKARYAIRNLGGALRSPTWAKVMLATVGLYEWRGLQSMCPELWMLPSWLPFHPSKFWCDLRCVFAPMAYLYGLLGSEPSKVTDPLLLKIREELYCQPYDSIKWEDQKLNLCENDMWAPPNWLLRIIYRFFNAWERVCPASLRQRTLAYLFKLVHTEDVYTKFTQRTSVAKNICMLANFYHSGPDTENYKLHLDRCRDYLWPSALGIRMTAANGMQVWDVHYGTQGLYAAVRGKPLADHVSKALVKGFDLLMVSQVIEDKISSDPYNLRQYEVGAFPYAATDHSNILSDSTGESLTALLQLIELGCVRPINDSLGRDLHWRILRAVDSTLGFQCDDGGCGAFEARRGGYWLEYINPVELFEGCVTEMSHVECTHSCLNALVLFQKTYPGGMEYRRKDIDNFVKRAMRYIEKKQRPDGGWRGNWGVNFTYGAAYCLRAYAITDQGYLDSGAVPAAVEKGCYFLLKHQNGDGGWSEDFGSLTDHRYIYGSRSSICQTAWALIGLISVNHPDIGAITRGIEFLISCQVENGEMPDGLIKMDYTPAKWSDAAIHGVANSVIPLVFPNYRHYYPMMAIGMYLNDYLPAYREGKIDINKNKT